MWGGGGEREDLVSLLRMTMGWVLRGRQRLGFEGNEYFGLLRMENQGP